MRIIAIGCEYTGVTTLLEGLRDWGATHGVHFHLDDHFTIPDAYHLSDQEQRAMLDMLPAIKERFQRFQIVYHVRLINNYQHILLGGFHLEEEVYGPLYYYPDLTVSDTRKYESEMPDDAILVHLHARPKVIAQRLEQVPHLFVKAVNECGRVATKYVVLIEPSYESGSEVTKNHIYKKGYIKITSNLLKKLDLSIVFRKILPIKTFHNGSEIIIFPPRVDTSSPS